MIDNFLNSLLSRLKSLLIWSQFTAELFGRTQEHCCSKKNLKQVCFLRTAVCYFFPSQKMASRMTQPSSRTTSFLCQHILLILGKRRSSHTSQLQHTHYDTTFLPRLLARQIFQSRHVTLNSAYTTIQSLKISYKIIHCLIF